jgi:protein O-mannosyl-transferase
MSLPGPSNRAAIVWQTALLAFATLAVYWPALHGAWLWDDTLDITGNEQLRDLSGLGQIWVHPSALYDFYPLKFSVQWIQWHLWGMAPTGYHVTNIVLHVLSALLIWRLLARLGVVHAWIGGLLFAVHPIAVESVAWITELKNTLSLPPLLIAFGFFVEYEERRQLRNYVGAIGFFVASMLCKTSGVMFPFVLLLYAWWRRSRLRPRDVLATVPFFAVSLALGLVTVWFQYHKAMTGGVPLGGIASRIALSGTAFVFYAWKCVVPINVMAIYPRWSVSPPLWWQFLPWPVLAAVLGWSWQHRATWRRHVLLGLGWFTLTLVPFLGFVAISYLRYSWVVDHMAYLPLVGIVGLAAAGLDVVRSRMPATGARVIAMAAVGGCLGLALVARGHAAVFRSGHALWTDVVARNPDAWFAQNNLGRDLLDAGEPQSAIPYFEAALRLNPDFIARTNLGTALYQTGRYDDALREFRTTLRLRPQDPIPHYNIGLVLQRTGHEREALAEFDAALQRNPAHVDSLIARGTQLRLAGQPDRALRDLANAVELSPADPTAHHQLALAFAAAGRQAESVAQYDAALRLAPGDAALHNDFASTLLAAGRTSDAVEQLRAAVKLKPDFDDARINLGLVLTRAGRADEAVPEFETVLQRQPDSLRARYNLAVALATAGRPADAIPHYERALALSPDSAQIHANLALALAATGRLPEARTHYAEARRLDPSLPPPPF